MVACMLSFCNCYKGVRGEIIVPLLLTEHVVYYKPFILMTMLLKEVSRLSNKEH